MIKQADEFTGVASPKLAFFLFCAGAVGLAKSDRCMENVEWKTEGGGETGDGLYKYLQSGERQE